MVSTRFVLVITFWSYQCLPDFLMLQLMLFPTSRPNINNKTGDSKVQHWSSSATTRSTLMPDLSQKTTLKASMTKISTLCNCGLTPPVCTSSILKHTHVTAYHTPSFCTACIWWLYSYTMKISSYSCQKSFLLHPTTNHNPKPLSQTPLTLFSTPETHKNKIGQIWSPFLPS